MPGPAPDPNALRRDRPSDKDGWTSLPSEGRGKPAPAWPLAAPVVDEDEGLDPSGRELEVWRRVWKLAQAVAWERNGSELEVALYVRHLVQAEGGDMKAAAEMRQWSDRLGLNPAAMLRLRWKIATDEVAVQRSKPAATAVKLSASERLKARNAEAV